MPDHFLYVFAHQDDEYGGAPWIEDATRNGTRVSAVYLTDGGSRAAPGLRDNESRLALKQLGVADDDVYFLSDGARIPDGGLPENVARGSRLVERWLDEHPDVTAIYAPAWEGGHPDHDAAHAIAAVAAGRRGLLASSWQFALYNGFRCPRPLFRVLKQLPTAAATRVRRHALGAGFRYAILCRAYPSQRRTWLGLFPGAFLRRVIQRREALVQLDLVRFLTRPHVGGLLYETMFGMSYESLANELSDIRCAAGAILQR